MKLARFSVILITLVLAPLAGSIDDAALHRAACSLDGVAHAMSGTSLASQSCRP
jgi:hypothetical protein